MLQTGAADGEINVRVEGGDHLSAQHASTPKYTSMRVLQGTERHTWVCFASSPAHTRTELDNVAAPRPADDTTSEESHLNALGVKVPLYDISMDCRGSFYRRNRKKVHKTD